MVLSSRLHLAREKPVRSGQVVQKSFTSAKMDARRRWRRKNTMTLAEDNVISQHEAVEKKATETNTKG